MIIGIDPSLTNTAVVAGDASEFAVHCFGSKNHGDDVHQRVARYDALVHRIITCVESSQPTAIMVEAYAFSRNDARAKYIAEFGGLLRWHLVDCCEHIFEVAATTLKKFATGKGNSDKLVVAAQLAKRYDIGFNTSDEYDAHGPYRLGLVACGIVKPDNAKQREAAETVIGMKLEQSKQPIPF